MTGTKTFTRTLTCTLGAVLLCTGLTATAEPNAKVEAKPSTGKNDVSVDLAYMTHLDMNLPEQDVFIEREPGSGKVYRVTRADNDMSVPLYKSAYPVKHDPFDPAALGPYDKGEPIGMTLGEWLKQTGTGRYTCKDGQARFETEFSNLVPGGVYTMWYAFMALPPTKPFSGTLDLPLGARDGSENVFVADENGKAKVVQNFTPCLQMSDVWTTAMLAVAYHSDGKTYGADPGPFGIHSHVPLFMMLPNREGLE